MEKIKIGISACLLGQAVRYDGGHRWDRYLTETLGRYFAWVPVCPEVEYGLGVPREAMRLEGDPERPRLVTVQTRFDHTEGMESWAEKRLADLAGERLSGFIFKSGSPSSGMTAVKVYNDRGVPVKKGVGIFARALMKRFPLLPVEEDGRLHHPGHRENFLERVFVYRRWQTMMDGKPKTNDLMDFHRCHKYLLMSHSPRHLIIMGRIVAAAGDGIPPFHTYASNLMEALRLTATPRKHTNVLMHMMGYLKKFLTADEKQELLKIIRQYQQGKVPRTVPLTLLSHYVRKYAVPYLTDQVYLHPHPEELMVMNHC